MEPTNPTIFFFFFSLSLLFFTYYFHFLLGFCFVGLFIFSGSLFCVHTQTNGRGSRVPFSLSLYVHLHTHADTRIKGEAGTARIGRCMENRREREDGYNKLKVAPALSYWVPYSLHLCVCVCVYTFCIETFILLLGIIIRNVKHIYIASKPYNNNDH